MKLIEQCDGLSMVLPMTDGLVEAIETKEKRFALGVQWRPKFIQNDGALKLIHAMIHA